MTKSTLTIFFIRFSKYKIYQKFFFLDFNQINAEICCYITYLIYISHSKFETKFKNCYNEKL